MATLTRYVAAAIQSGIDHGDKTANLDRLEGLVREAAAKGATLIVTPEMATVGIFWVSRDEIAPFVETIPGPTTERFAAIARELKVFVVIGMAEVDPDTDTYYNAAALIGPDGLIGKHRKVHAYISEPLWAADGNLGFQTWDTPLGRLGMMICMDANYPESGLMLAHGGADVILLPTNWVVETCPAPLWMTRARDSRAMTIAANRWDSERGYTFSGGSAILDADGTICACAGTEQHDQIVLAEIDLTPHTEALPAPRPSLYRPLAFNRHTWSPLAMHRSFGQAPLPDGKIARVAALSLQASVTDTPAEEIFAATEAVKFVQKASLVVLPEYSFTGVPTSAGQAALFAEPLDGPTLDLMTRCFADNGLFVVGSIIERADARLYSTLLLVGPGGLVTHYRKTHLSAQEAQWLTPGDQLVWADTPPGRIGLLAGSDLLRPEPIRALAIEGVDIVCVAASPDFPTALTRAQTAATDEPDAVHWHLARVRAAENDVYVAFAGWQDAGIFFGPVLFEAEAVEAWATPVEGARTRVATLDVDTRIQWANSVNPLKTKPSLQRRIPVLYNALQQSV